MKREDHIKLNESQKSILVWLDSAVRYIKSMFKKIEDSDTTYDIYELDADEDVVDVLVNGGKVSDANQFVQKINSVPLYMMNGQPFELE